MAIDPKLIDDLNSRRKKVILSGGQEKIDKRHEKGEMTARDRMGYLFEEGTFSEIGMHVRHNCHNFGMGKKEIPGDGVVSGFGLVNGRPVACAASDSASSSLASSAWASSLAAVVWVTDFFPPAPLAPLAPPVRVPAAVPGVVATSVATSAAGSEPAPPPEAEVALGLPVGVAGAPPVARGVDAMGSVTATVADSWLLLINRRVATTPIITNSAKRAARRRRR